MANRTKDLTDHIETLRRTIAGKEQEIQNLQNSLTDARRALEIVELQRRKMEERLFKIEACLRALT